MSDKFEAFLPPYLNTSMRDCDSARRTLSEIAEARLVFFISNGIKKRFVDNKIIIFSTSLRKYTNAYQNKVGAKAPMGSVIKGLLKSPDYKFKDV